MSSPQISTPTTDSGIRSEPCRHLLRLFDGNAFSPHNAVQIADRGAKAPDIGIVGQPKQRIVSIHDFPLFGDHPSVHHGPRQSLRNYKGLVEFVE